MSSHGAALAVPLRGSMKDGFSFGMAILGLALLVAIIGPSLVPHDPLTQELAARNAPPNVAHWFGYDHLGRDVLARLVAGTRISLAVALGATLLAMLLGAGLGLAARAMWRPRGISSSASYPSSASRRKARFGKAACTRAIMSAMRAGISGPYWLFRVAAMTPEELCGLAVGQFAQLHAGPLRQGREKTLMHATDPDILLVFANRRESAGCYMQPPGDNQIDKTGQQQRAGDQDTEAGVDEGRGNEGDDAENADGFWQTVTRRGAVAAHRRLDVAIRIGRPGNFTIGYGDAAPDAKPGKLVAMAFDHHIFFTAINAGRSRQNQTLRKLIHEDDGSRQIAAA